MILHFFWVLQKSLTFFFGENSSLVKLSVKLDTRLFLLPILPENIWKRTSGLLFKYISPPVNLPSWYKLSLHSSSITSSWCCGDICKELCITALTPSEIYSLRVATIVNYLILQFWLCKMESNCGKLNFPIQPFRKRQQRVGHTLLDHYKGVLILETPSNATIQYRFCGCCCSKENIQDKVWRMGIQEISQDKKISNIIVWINVTVLNLAPPLIIV